ncbi:MAG: LVIVD repeat-containing protein [bacterium]
MKEVRFIIFTLFFITVFILFNCGEDLNVWEILGSLKLSGNDSLNGIVSEGGYAYISSGSDGIFVCDVSDPKEPSSVSLLNIGGKAVSVFKKDNYLFSACKDKGLFIVDVTDPKAPTVIGNDVVSGMSAESAVAQDNYAYWVGGTLYEGYLFITDCSIPTSPTHVSTTKICNMILATIYVDGIYAYIGDYEGVFYIVNISNPVSPTLVATLTNTNTQKNSQAKSITKWGNYVFFSNWGRGLFIIDVTNPSAPYIILNLPFDDSVFDCKILEPYMILAVSYSGLFRFDITDIANPTKQGNPLVPSGASIVGVSADGNFAYFINGSQQYLYTVKVK